MKVDIEIDAGTGVDVDLAVSASWGVLPNVRILDPT